MKMNEDERELIWSYKFGVWKKDFLMRPFTDNLQKYLQDNEFHILADFSWKAPKYQYADNGMICSFFLSEKCNQDLKENTWLADLQFGFHDINFIAIIGAPSMLMFHKEFKICLLNDFDIDEDESIT